MGQPWRSTRDTIVASMGVRCFVSPKEKRLNEPFRRGPKTTQKKTLQKAANIQVGPSSLLPLPILVPSLSNVIPLHT